MSGFADEQVRRRFFREHQFPVFDNFECAASALYQLNAIVTVFHQPVPRTESLWFVVSLHAVFNRNFHNIS